LATPSLHASEAPFLTGRFVNDGRDVYSGVFRNNVDIDSLTLGTATFRASMNELIEPLSVRISVDVDGDGNFELLTDEMLRDGSHPAAIAIAAGIDAEKYPTALDAMQGLSLAHMLFTDGSAAVQIDMLLVVSLYDDDSDDDTSPELIVLGSVDGHDIKAAAIIGGNVDDPILAQQPVAMSAESFATGTTGMSMVIRQTARPQSFNMSGLDLSHDLGVEEGVQALGYRIIIGPGKPAMLNVLGAGGEMQRTLAQNMPIFPDLEDFLLGAVVGNSWNGGGSVFRVPGVTESPIYFARVPLDFQGSGGGGGGGGRTTPPTTPPTDPEEPLIPAPATLPALLLLFARQSRRRA